MIAALGFGIYIALALSTTFRHGWEFPYKWYSLIMLYLSACCFVSMPVFDFIYESEYSRATYVAVDIATNLLAPMVMTAFVSLAQTVRKLNFQTVFLTWIPFVLYFLVYHFADEIPFLLYTVYAYVVLNTLFWANRISFRVKEFRNRLNDSTIEMDISWMKPYGWVIAVMVIVKFSLLTFLPMSANGHFKPQLFAMLVIYMPIIILYEWQYSRHRYFENYDFNDTPTSNFSNSLFSTSATSTNEEKQQEVRVAKSQMQRQAPLPPNAILPHLTAGAMEATTTATPDEDDPEAINSHIDTLLHRMERDTQFYLDKELSATELAKHLGVSRIALSTYFHDRGTTFYDYIENLRISVAAELLVSMPDAGMDLIAFKSGFGSRSNFHRSFVNYYHTSPEDYRKSKLNP